MGAHEMQMATVEAVKRKNMIYTDVRRSLRTFGETVRDLQAAISLENVVGVANTLGYLTGILYAYAGETSHCILLEENQFIDDVQRFLIGIDYGRSWSDEAAKSILKIHVPACEPPA